MKQVPLIGGRGRRRRLKVFAGERLSGAEAARGWRRVDTARSFTPSAGYPGNALPSREVNMSVGGCAAPGRRLSLAPAATLDLAKLGTASHSSTIHEDEREMGIFPV
ncbi:Hypothetical protein NTJ_10786 [Nesidiocoris tenuis]|uniref:Uncharacterized protein n=1 Tax=Nesidiocoris tenuis TaxID=355587 RepID=A0ABN7B0N3_9HEMI|nr:Hypothetical protein NTJ_10786 [Nesidiocoris tenuis]